jgi:glycolate oxidase
MFDSFEDAVTAQLELFSLELVALSTSLSSDSFGREHAALAAADPQGRFHAWLILELEGDRSEVSKARRVIGRVVGARKGHKIRQCSMDSLGDVLLLFTKGAKASGSPPPNAGAKVRVSRHLWVPPEKILEVYRAYERLVQKYQIDDANALNTPTRLIVGWRVDPKNQREIVTLAAFQEDLQRIARGAGGTLFGAHGAGLVNKAAIEADYGDGSIALMRKIKFALDPNLIMNPAKVLDMEGAYSRLSKKTEPPS